MDPTWNALAHKLRFEMLAETDASKSNNTVLHQLGSLLVSAGQKLQASGWNRQAAFESEGYPLLNNDVCV
jgi:hypothetical protein